VINLFISSVAALFVNFIYIDTPYRIALFVMLAVGGSAATRWLDELLQGSSGDTQNQKSNSDSK
jgi:hypothetical protein